MLRYAFLCHVLCNIHSGAEKRMLIRLKTKFHCLVCAGIDSQDSAIKLCIIIADALLEIECLRNLAF